MLWFVAWEHDCLMLRAGTLTSRNEHHVYTRTTSSSDKARRYVAHLTGIE
jgi:hypothetical protein